MTTSISSSTRNSHTSSSIGFHSNEYSNGGEGPSWNLDKVLIGREAESKSLTDLANQVSNQDTHAVVVVHGAAGSGKSALIKSQGWEEQGWVLATGKFERLSIEPFSAIVQAVTQVVKAWIIQNKAAEVCQMGGFRNLLEEDVEYLRNIVPAAYLAATDGLCCLDPNSSYNTHNKKKRSSSFTMKQDMGTVDCLNASFVRILRFLCQRQKVVLFVDDLQWADASSLELIRVLASGTAGSIKNLILTVSYRDEEVNNDHPVMKVLEGVKSLETESQSTLIHDIAVGNLNVENVNRLVATVCGHEDTETLPLSKVIHEKTAGNPFFVSQFLLMLRQEHFLTYSFSTYKWEWGDVDKLSQAAHVSDNVADIIGNSLKCMPEATQVAVSLASCLGRIVPLNVLIEYFGQEETEEEKPMICDGVRQIQLQGLQTLLDDAVKRGILIQPEGDDAYMWAHDKLQHVAYSLIPEEFRPILHKGLGKVLWNMSKTHPDEEWMVFMAAEQCNRYSGNQNGQALGAEVAVLCMEAANLSLSKSALIPAFDMLMASKKHLSIENKWKTHYDLSLKLFSTIAALATQLGKTAEAKEAVEEVEANAKSFEDKFSVQCVAIESISSGADRNYKAGVTKTLEILKEYGVRFPKTLLPGQLFVENQRLRRKFPHGKIEGLSELPRMTDKKSHRIMKLLVQYLGPFLLLSRGDPNLNTYAGLRGLFLSVEKGLCEETALAICGVAIFILRTGHMKEADDYATLALKIIEGFPKTIGSLHSQVHTMTAAGIFSITRPLNKAMEMFLDSHHVALKTGATEKAAASVMCYTFTYIVVGLPLGPLKSDLLQYEKEARQFNMPETVGAIFHILEQSIINLQETMDNPTSLKGTAMNEDEMLASLSGNGRQMTKRDIYTFRLLLCCIYGDWSTAEILLEDLQQYEKDIFVVRTYLRRTVMGLAALKLARTTGKRKYRTLGKKILKEFGNDVKSGNINAHPIHVMLQAEAYRSKENYDNAIRACARLGLLHYEAYLCERAAEFFQEENDAGWSEFYLAQAFVLYNEWGATGKSMKLEAEHPEFLKSSSLQERAHTALKGRTRYSSEHVDMLKDMNWERLSSMSTSVSTVTGSSRTSRSSDNTLTPKVEEESDKSTSYLTSDTNSEEEGAISLTRQFSVAGLMT